jgi:arsenate reductase
MNAGPDIIIYHNTTCGTSRNTLAMIRNAQIEPHVIEYLKTPPSRALLASLIERMNVPVRSVLREKGTPLHALGLGDTNLTDAQFLDAMMAHPILINRPIVVSPLGVKLCRPSEAVLDLLPNPQLAAFTKEDGERVVDASGRRLAPVEHQAMSEAIATAVPAVKAPTMGIFERYLTLWVALWVALCIVVGIALGRLIPGVFHLLGTAEVAHVNLPVAVLVWLMIIPMLLKIDLAALGTVGAQRGLRPRSASTGW